MQKIYGATERQDGLYPIGRNKWELIYGFGKDAEADETGYNYRRRFTRKPTPNEIKEIIIRTIDTETDATILNGFVWHGIRVWLSQENQFNFKAAYDMAEMSQGASLPVTFKLGEDADGNPVYHEFGTIEDFRDFYTNAMTHIVATLNRGWTEKDSIDLANFGCDE